MHLTNEAKVLLGIGIATLLIIIVGVFLLSKNPETGPTNSSTQAQTADPNILVREDSHKIATSSSKLTITEFSDFQCPACRAAQPTVDQALQKYQGKFNFVYRHFPLTQHKNAEVAAQASEAAAAQNKFWEFHDKLFATQDEWANLDNPLETFIKYAGELKLADINKFKQEIESKKYLDKVRKDYSDGVTANVNSTPTFYFNNTKYSGDFNPKNFNAKIEELTK